VNKPYAFVIVFRSTKENEVKYYAIQPHRTEIETDLVEFLTWEAPDLDQVRRRVDRGR